MEGPLTESKLLHSSLGSRRSSYCFPHTYATFRLAEGVEVYFLAKQMGTSVKMIEDHYGHVPPVKNAEQILERPLILASPRSRSASRMNSDS